MTMTPEESLCHIELENVVNDHLYDGAFPDESTPPTSMSPVKLRNLLVLEAAYRRALKQLESVNKLSSPEAYFAGLSAPADDAIQGAIDKGYLVKRGKLIHRNRNWDERFINIGLLSDEELERRKRIDEAP